MGGIYQLSICSVSIGEKEKTTVMKENIHEYGEREHEKREKIRDERELESKRQSECKSQEFSSWWL